MIVPPLPTILACVALVVACTQQDEGPPPNAVAGDKGMAMSDAEVAQAVQLANDGDNIAAKGLSLHFENNGRGDLGDQWLLVAARRGDCEALILLIDHRNLYRRRIDADLEALASKHGCEDYRPGPRSQ